MIYHYTTIQALNNMLNNCIQDKLVFWASSIYTMNDPTEMEYGWGILKHYFKIYEDDNCITDEIRLSNYMKDIEESKISNIIFNHIYDDKKTPFVIAFSCQKDYLPMWSMYGGNGYGVCLCFDENVLCDGTKDIQATPPEDILYLGNEQNNNISSNMIKYFIDDEYKTYLNDIKEGKDLETNKTVTIGTLIPLVSAFLKDCSYEYEKEKRLVLLGSSISKSWCFRNSSKGNVIPYIEVPIPVKSLKEIIIGPCVNPQNVKSGLQMHLIKCNYNIPISQSQVPYRDI